MQHLVDSLGHDRERRPALLHSRQRAEHLAFDASRRSSHRRRRWTEIRDKTIELRAADQGRRPDGARRRAGRVGLERILLQRLRPAVRQHARLELSAGPHQPRRRRLSALAARPAAPASDDVTASACSTSSPSTTTRRAASSATTCRPRCSCAATARRARCGIRTTSTRPGSTTGSSSSRG